MELKKQVQQILNFAETHGTVVTFMATLSASLAVLLSELWIDFYNKSKYDRLNVPLYLIDVQKTEVEAVYLIASFVIFAIAGALAILMYSQYDQVRAYNKMKNVSKYQKVNCFFDFWSLFYFTLYSINLLAVFFLLNSTWNRVLSNILVVIDIIIAKGVVSAVVKRKNTEQTVDSSCLQESISGLSENQIKEFEKHTAFIDFFLLRKIATGILVFVALYLTAGAAGYYQAVKKRYQIINYDSQKMAVIAISGENYVVAPAKLFYQEEKMFSRYIRLPNFNFR